MKTLLAVVGTLGIFTAPAIAGPKWSEPANAGERGKPKKKPVAEVKQDKVKKPAFGESFDLVPRRSAQPREEAEAEKPNKPRGLSETQVATVVNKRIGDIQHCWNKLPQSHRIDACTAVLKLSVSEAGRVTALELAGDVPAGAHRCITSAVSRWTFPVAEVNSDVEYAISLRSL